MIILNIIKECLEAGMTTDKSPDIHEYYVKTWFMGEPNPIPATSLPAGTISSTTPETRETVFPGMDTVTETITIRLYSHSARKAEEELITALGYTKINAMVDRALELLRTDPVFGCRVVTSRIISVNRQYPASPDALFRVGEIILQVQRRVLWG